jgi:hypothetical protein
MDGDKEEAQPEAVSAEVNSATTHTARRQKSRAAAAGAAEAAARRCNLKSLFSKFGSVPCTHFRNFSLLLF